MTKTLHALILGATGSTGQELLKLLLEDFINLHSSKKSKILNLETEIKDIKIKMSNYIDELENFLKQN